MTCGVARPAILFPCDAPGWDAADLDRAIVHELEHVRRRDWAINCLAHAVCAVYWFHPLVWIAWRRLELEAERACDDAVLARSEPTAYADQLVSVARRLSAASKPPLLAMASRADLSARVTSVLDNRRRRGRAGRPCVAAASTAAAALVLALSPLRVIAAPQPARGGVQLRVETALVMVDAAVSYPNGATIEGLSAGDFTLTEDGVPQRISVFEFQKTDGPAPVTGHYVLGYYSASPNADGQFRKIEISVKNASTAKIEARAGYVAKKWADTPRIALAEPVEPGVRPPVLLYKKEPEYPEEARKAKFQGHVMLSVSVDTSGRTDKIRVQRAVGLGLDEKAVEAVRQWRFRPAMKGGKPIAVSITVDVSFRLM